MAPVGRIFGPLWPQIVPKLGQKAFFRLFCKRFPLDSNENCVLRSLERLWGGVWGGYIQSIGILDNSSSPSHQATCRILNHNFSVHTSKTAFLATRLVRPPGLLFILVLHLQSKAALLQIAYLFKISFKLIGIHHEILHHRSSSWCVLSCLCQWLLTDWLIESMIISSRICNTLFSPAALKKIVMCCSSPLASLCADDTPWRGGGS